MDLKLFATSVALFATALVAPLTGQQSPAREPITPIEPARVTRPALVGLGKKLYFDPRLSRSGFISCNS